MATDRLDSLKNSLYDATEGVRSTPIMGASVVAVFACVLLWVTRGVLTENNILVLGVVTCVYLLVHGFNEWRKNELTTKTDLATLDAYTKALEILNKDGAMTENELATAARILAKAATPAATP